MESEKDKKIFVWPDLAFMEFLTAVLLTIVLIVWALLANAPLLEIANPGISENPSKAPWYFVGLQELLVYFDPWIAGVMIPSIIILGLMLIPYLDNNPAGTGQYNFSVRKFALINFSAGFSMWLILIFTGYFLRGPNWQFYSPWESWNIVKEIENNLWSLSPAAGLTSMAAYLAAGLIAPRFIFPHFYKTCGPKRYTVVMLLMLLMYAVPIKILLRLVFNIKYVLITPWFNV